MLTPEEKRLLIDLLRNDLHFTEEQISGLYPLFAADVNYKEVVTHLFHATAFNKYVKKEDMPDFIIRTLSQYYGVQLMQEKRRKELEIAYFKRPQGNDYHFYKVYGGPGKTKDGYQEVINFLNPDPIISIEHNSIDTNELIGTWCTYEVGEPITKEEYEAAYERATAGTFSIK